jgi:hypothetical protein
MGARRGEGHRPLGKLLPADVGEIHFVSVKLGDHVFRSVGNRIELKLSGHGPDRLGERGDGEDL